MWFSVIRSPECFLLTYRAPEPAYNLFMFHKIPANTRPEPFFLELWLWPRSRTAVKPSILNSCGVFSSDVRTEYLTPTAFLPFLRCKRDINVAGHPNSSVWSGSTFSRCKDEKKNSMVGSESHNPESIYRHVMIAHGIFE